MCISIGVRERALRDDISLSSLSSRVFSTIYFAFSRCLWFSGFLTFSDTSGIVFSTGIFSVPSLARRYLPSFQNSFNNFLSYSLSFSFLFLFFFFLISFARSLNIPSVNHRLYRYLVLLAFHTYIYIFLFLARSLHRTIRSLLRVSRTRLDSRLSLCRA